MGISVFYFLTLLLSFLLHSYFTLTSLMSNAAVESPLSTPTVDNIAVDIPVEISTPPIDLEMSLLDEGSNTSYEDEGWWCKNEGCWCEDERW
ncbi:hypothetical protein Tco_1253519 [Tanacetum coccineum]